MGNISWKLYRNVRSSVMYREKLAAYLLPSLQITSKGGSICVASVASLSYVTVPRAHLLPLSPPIPTCLSPSPPSGKHN